MKTVIKFSTRKGGELDRIELSDRDATSEGIAQATIDMIPACMSMRDGDIIEVVEEDSPLRSKAARRRSI
jgi:hypothetical protein